MLWSSGPLRVVLSAMIVTSEAALAASEQFAFEEIGSTITGRSSEPGLRTLTGSGPASVSAVDYSASHARLALLPPLRQSITVGDIDRDGEPDFFVASGDRANLLLRNVGRRKVHDISAAAGLNRGDTRGLSAAFSDYDRSGRQSLFIAGVEGVAVYRNNGDRTFSDVTQKAGLPRTPGELATSAVLDDLDGDGLPDLLVTVYTDLNRPPSKPIFAFPNDFSGAASRLYRNNGNGTFTDVTESTGLDKNPGRARKGVLMDFNGDLRPDVLMLRDNKPPALYLNRGDWRFEDKTWDAGDALTSHAFFDAAVADWNADGKMDLALWSSLSCRVLLNKGKAVFALADSMPLFAPSPNLFGFHGTAANLDGDGFEDLISTGHDGSLRAFVNHGGIFQEASVTLPPGLEGSYLAPVRMKGDQRSRLLAIHPGGKSALLRSKAATN